MDANMNTAKKSSGSLKIGQPVTNEDFLRDSEEVLWEGKPADFKVISAQSRGEIIVKWLVLPLMFLVLILLHIHFTDIPNMALIIGLILLALILAGSVFFKRKRIMKCRYLLTNERIVMVNSDYAYYIRLNDVDGFRVVRDQTDNPTILFGSAIYKDIEKHLLWRAAADISIDVISGDEASCFNLTFYNAKNADELIGKLHSLGIKEN